MQTAPYPAVVLGGGYNALAVVRGLGRIGVPVDFLFLSDGGDLPVDRSRYVRRTVDLRAAPDGAEHCLDWLTAAEPSVVLFSGDDGARFVARHRAELVSAGHMPMEADDDVLMAMLDKSATYDLARAAGIPCPWSRAVSDPDGLRRAVAELELPCVVKPAFSQSVVTALEGGKKGVLVRDATELEAVAGPAARDGVTVVLTEFIPGPPDSFSSYYTYLDSAGEPRLHVTKRKLRQYPLGFGEGTYHLMAHEPEVAEVGLRFFQGVGYRGLGNVEFRRDARDGTWKLMECNPRFTAATELIRHAGVDLVAFCYRWLAGLGSEAPGDFRDGLSMWLPRNDWRAYREHRRRGELDTATWLRQVARPHQPALVDGADPGPALALLARRAAGVPRRLARRRTGG